MSYTFKLIENCNMCGEPVSSSRVIGKRMNQSQGIRPTRKIGITTTIMKCGNCDLVYANPLPIPESLNQHYGTPPEDYWKPEYFKVQDTYFKHQIETFYSLHGKTENLTALDIGAGIGKCMIALKGAGFDAFGLEPSEAFYTRAIERMGISKDALQLSSIEEAVYESAQFDFITFGAVL